MEQVTVSRVSSHLAGPVELDVSMLHLVSGGLPKGTWSESGTDSLPKGTWAEALPKGTWAESLPKGTW